MNRPYIQWGTLSGWVRRSDGIHWSITRIDGTRREGITKTVGGAKSAMTQIKRREGLS